jgi:hypothetical protein
VENLFKICFKKYNTIYKGLNTKKPNKLPPVLQMAPRTTICLFFVLIGHFLRSKSLEIELCARHMTHLAQRPENNPLPNVEILIMPFETRQQIIEINRQNKYSYYNNAIW